MDRARLFALAWSLVELSEATLSRPAHGWLCVTIGAGDPEPAILELVRALAVSRTTLPEELSDLLWDWASGYCGSDSEARVRDLLARLGVREPIQPRPQSLPPLEKSCERPRGTWNSCARADTVDTFR